MDDLLDDDIAQAYASPAPVAPSGGDDLLDDDIAAARVSFEPQGFSTDRAQVPSLARTGYQNARAFKPEADLVMKADDTSSLGRTASNVLGWPVRTAANMIGAVGRTAFDVATPVGEDIAQGMRENGVLGAVSNAATLIPRAARDIGVASEGGQSRMAPALWNAAQQIDPREIGGFIPPIGAATAAIGGLNQGGIGGVLDAGASLAGMGMASAPSRAVLVQKIRGMMQAGKMGAVPFEPGPGEMQSWVNQPSGPQPEPLGADPFVGRVADAVNSVARPVKGAVMGAVDAMRRSVNLEPGAIDPSMDLGGSTPTPLRGVRQYENPAGPMRPPVEPQTVAPLPAQPVAAEAATSIGAPRREYDISSGGPRDPKLGAIVDRSLATPESGPYVRSVPGPVAPGDAALISILDDATISTRMLDLSAAMDGTPPGPIRNKMQQRLHAYAVELQQRSRSTPSAPRQQPQPAEAVVDVDTSPQATPVLSPRPEKGGGMIPVLPPLTPADEALVHPPRPMNLRDQFMSRATASGSWLGPTEGQMSAAGAPLKPGTGGSGLGGMLAQRSARADWTARTIADRVIGDATSVKEGSPGDLMAARVAEGKGSPSDLAAVNSDPQLRGLVDRWTQLREEAVANPDVEIRGFIDNYVTHARAQSEPLSFVEFLDKLENGGAGERVGSEQLTSYLQHYRGNEGGPPSLVRAARAYGRALGFELEIKPGLKRAQEFLRAKSPEGTPYVDATDQSLLNTWIHDAYLGREQNVDVLARRTPGIKEGTALLNTALSRVGLPTVQNPLKATVAAGRGAANWTLVRPAAAALSHFLGDVWPKLARKGAAGIGEYADGAAKALVSLGPAEWDRLEQLGVAQRLPASTIENPAFRGLGTAGKRVMGAVTTVDTASKVGTFYSELTRLVGEGMPTAEAESLAATLTRARNYYPNAIQSIPASSSRGGSVFYQFLKPGINAADNIREWVAQGDGKALVTTALGAAGLYALGQATDLDFIKRVHILPTSAEPAIFKSRPTLGALDLEDPFGVTNRRSK